MVSGVKKRSRVDLMHCGADNGRLLHHVFTSADMIGDQFWAQNADIFPEEERISRDKLPQARSSEHA